MFKIFKEKEKSGSVFVSGVFYKDGDEENVHTFVEYSGYGGDSVYKTADDFIRSVHQLHKKAGYRSQFKIVQFN